MSVDLANFRGIQVGPGKKRLEFKKFESVLPLLPVELYHKVDGSEGSLPMFSIVLVDPLKPSAAVTGEVSFSMLRRALQSVGYELKRVGR